MQDLGYREYWKYPQRETVAFCVLEDFATLCLIGFGIGRPLGHARATQASPKGNPSVDLGKVFVCNESKKMAGGGTWEKPLNHKGHEETRSWRGKEEEVEEQLGSETQTVRRRGRLRSTSDHNENPGPRGVANGSACDSQVTCVPQIPYDPQTWLL